MMKILLTGSSGFLGSEIAQSLTQYELSTLNRNQGTYKIALESTIPFFTEKFDIVIHSAGKAHCVPKSKEEIQSFYDVNVRGTLNLLKGIEKVGMPEQFVFISSVSVYGLDQGKQIKEDSPLFASDPYGKSKIEAEKIISSWCKENGVICTILRLPLIVGKNPPGNLGAMINGIRKGYYFNIGGGLARKSMVLAQDVAESILVVGAVGGVYHLTDGVHPNFKELSIALSKNMNKDKPKNIPRTFALLVGFLGDLLGNRFPLNTNKVKKISSELTFDDSKARETFNWNPRSVIDYITCNNISST